MRLYVIGPVTGHEDDNRAAFKEASSVLASAGHIAHTPHDYIHSGTPHEEAMTISLNVLTAYDCDYLAIDRATLYKRFDGVAMLDGWEKSKGATLEHAVAEACGIPCKPWREWLYADRNGAGYADGGAAQPIFAPAC